MKARPLRPVFFGVCVHTFAALYTPPASAQNAPPNSTPPNSTPPNSTPPNSTPPNSTSNSPQPPKNQPNQTPEGEPKTELTDKSGAAADAKTIDVKVIGNSIDALQKVPGSGQLVGAKDIARAQPFDAAELLRRVPGIVARQEPGAGMRLDISIRGLDGTRGRRVLVLEDGVPVSNNPYGEPDLYYATPFERIRGIEVVKGSGSILYGPQTIGGVVHFLTHAAPESRRAYVWLNGGYPGQFELLGRYGDSFKNIRYLAQVFGKRADGARDEGSFATDALLKLATSISDNHELSAKAAYHEEAATSSDLGLTRAMFENDPRRPTLSPFDRISVRHIDGSITHKYSSNSGTEVTTIGYITHTSRLWRRQDYDRIAEPGIAYQRISGDITAPGAAIYFRNTLSLRDRSYWVFGIEPRLKTTFTTASIRHSLEAGIRVLGETAHRTLRAADNLLAETGELQSDENSHTFAVAAYVQDAISVTDNLLVTPGFRLEIANSQRDIHTALVNNTPTEVAISGNSTLVAPIPGIGMVIGTPDLHGFGGIHVGFAPPRLTTAITENGIDEQLSPERAIHYEVGLRVKPFRYLRAEATFFLSNFENQIIPVARIGSATTDLANAGRTRHLGVETQVRADVGAAFHWPLSVELLGSATFLSAVFAGGDDDGRPLPYAPPLTASAVLDIEHPFGIGAQAAFNFVAPQFADDAATTKEDPSGRIGQVPAYSTLDLSLRYTHSTSGIGATLAIKNVLDSPYIVSRRPDGIFPAGFRQIIAGVRYTYGAR
ncbi:MAG: TonB-dependent receptor [Polyangiaceae bacterium]|nr:TonB-dependent receptor [Polyangiaceae bacterium]